MAQGFTTLPFSHPEAAAVLAAFKEKKGYEANTNAGKCEVCGKVILLSGLGVGSHRKSHRS